MKTTSFIMAAVLAGATTAVTFGAVTPDVQGTSAGANDWCGNNSYSSDRETHSEVREFTVPAVGAPLTVDAAPNGGIKVAGEARGDIHVVACVSATGATVEEARALAQRVDVTATVDRVAAEGPRNLGRRENWHVSYRIAVPNRTSLSLTSSNGGIDISDVDGQIAFRTVNGGVKLTRLAGNVRGRTSNGGVSVDLDGTTWTGDGLDVETNNGGVNMSIPSNYSARLETGTVNGRMNIDFPVTVQGKIGRSIETQLGSGGALLRVRTSNGGVNIRQK
jgi:hypothetical protein